MGINKLIIVFLSLYFANVVQSASILALFSSLSHADHLVFRGYISLLVKKGHSAVVMTPYPGHFEHSDAEKIVEIDVGEESAKFWDEFKQLMTNTDDYYPNMKEINELSVRIAVAQLKTLQMTTYLANPKLKFDLVVTEADMPILYAVADKYKVPHIALTATTGKIHHYESKGNTVHPFIFPDVNSLSCRDMSIWQKIIELIRHIQTKREHYYNFMPLCQMVAEKILGLKRDLQQVEHEIDMLLIASNPLLIGNRPNVQGIAYADGMHLKDGGTLPKDLKSVLDSATKGVVYFSLGAIQESEDLSPLLLQNLADAFRELPYTVLWKIGNVTGINKPENVVAQSWFPQQEVLAHPNVKVFITHGGLRSLEEALFYEIPIIGFPIVKSRKVFIEEITKFGAGEILDPYYVDKNTLKAKIIAVASDKKYQEAITRLRLLMDDPVISGPENAVWWTEYVLQYEGAAHLRSAIIDYGFVKYYMLDVIGVLLLGILSIIMVIYMLLRYIINCVRRRFSGAPDLGRKFKAL